VTTYNALRAQSKIIIPQGSRAAYGAEAITFDFKVMCGIRNETKCAVKALKVMEEERRMEEVEYGLPVPREAMRLAGNPETPRLITNRTGIDHTDGMLKWAVNKAGELEKERLCGFLFKSKSPSSGMRSVKVYADSGMPSQKGVGIFAGAFMQRFPLVPVEDDGRLHDPVLRENFIETIFAYKRWQEHLDKGKAAKDLVEFHTDHKLLFMSHSPKHSTNLGRLVAQPKGSAGSGSIRREEYDKRRK